MAMRKVLSFNGKDSFVRVERRPEHEITQNITLEAWVYIESNETEYAGIISKVLDTPTKESGYGLCLNGMGGMYFALRPVAGDEYLYIPDLEAELVVPERAWHHLAATYDGKEMVVYIDGERKAAQKLDNARIKLDPAHDMFLGATIISDEERYFFHGKIAEARVWNVARTPAQIQGAMNGPLQGNEPGLVYYAPLDEGTGQTTGDQSKDAQGQSRGATGTIQGATWEDMDAPFAKEAPQPPAPQPAPQPAPAGSGLAGVIPTGAVLSAALERLNRQSMVRLLKELVEEVDEHCRTFGGMIDEKVAALRQELIKRINLLEENSLTCQESITNLNKLVQSLQKQMNGFENDFEVNVEKIINENLSKISKSVGDSEYIKQVIDQSIQSFIEGNHIGEVDLGALELKLQALKEQMALIEEAANSLNKSELTQVQALLEKVVQNIDFGSILAKLKLTINGVDFDLQGLLETLAGADKLAAVHFAYNSTDISGATFVLTSGEAVQFVCERNELNSGAQIEYVFKSSSWHGLPASFTLRFGKSSWKRTMCDRTVGLDTYDVVYESNIVFDLLAKADAKTMKLRQGLPLLK